MIRNRRSVMFHLACFCMIIAGFSLLACHDHNDSLIKRIQVFLASGLFRPPAPVVTGVSLNKNATVILVAGTERLYAAVTPSYAPNKKVTWSSSDRDVATVSPEGLVTGTGAGPATITARTSDGGFTAACAVTVSSTPVSVTGVTLDASDISLPSGETRVLAESIAPSDATNQNVTWTSDDEAAATVSPWGLVAAVAVGDAVITVTSADGGFTATCAVTVTESNTIADYRHSKESVLRSIPDDAIQNARNSLRIYYFHTSHGSRVISGMDGLMSYKTGDNTKFAFTSGGTPVSGQLHFQEDGYDLSAQEATWDDSVRTYLASHTDINVVMGSWCDPAGHDHHSYVTRMEELIEDYPGITFVFMTGHPNGDGESALDTSAYHCHTTVTEHCRANNRFCIDYWSIETHGMDDVYFADANDNGVAGGVTFFTDWMEEHAQGVDYFNTDECAHADQPITCNRIAYASWWIWARIAGWDMD